MRWFSGFGACCLLLTLAVAPSAIGGEQPEERKPPVVRVGAKAFTESIILGELARDLARSAGAQADRQDPLGDTSKVWKALLLGAIDVYCEYTGTLTQEILSDEHVKTDAEVRQALARRGLRMSRSLGFSDNYALGMKEERAAALSVRTISDLRRHPDLKLGLSNQFIERGDGWAGLKRRYQLPFRTPEGLEHSLAYKGLNAGTYDVIDLYTTDAEIARYQVRVLEDDRHYFPPYEAVLLYRADLAERAPEVVKALLRLEGAISVEDMRAMNKRALVDNVSDAHVAADFLKERFGMRVEVPDETLWQRLWLRTWQHVLLVSVSLALAIALAVPLGIVAARRPRLGQLILGAVGVLQTLPALALLGFLLVMLKRTGPVPAIVALFLYSLLPIVRNTYTGLHDIPLHIRESAEALGLPPLARLRLIELPMASRAILAGIKTSAVINVGYATLGGLIGAGGYGQPIIIGLNKDSNALILEGAIPAVLLALLVQGLFEFTEHFMVPKGLRLPAAR